MVNHPFPDAYLSTSLTFRTRETTASRLAELALGLLPAEQLEGGQGGRAAEGGGGIIVPTPLPKREREKVTVISMVIMHSTASVKQSMHIYLSPC